MRAPNEKRYDYTNCYGEPCIMYVKPDNIPHHYICEFWRDNQLYGAGQYTAEEVNQEFEYYGITDRV